MVAALIPSLIDHLIKPVKLEGLSPPARHSTRLGQQSVGQLFLVAVDDVTLTSEVWLRVQHHLVAESGTMARRPPGSVENQTHLFNNRSFYYFFNITEFIYKTISKSRINI